MNPNTYKEAESLIKAAQEVSGLPVRVSWDNELAVGAMLHLSETDYTKQIRISVNPDRKDIAYLVASQCMVAIRFYQQHKEQHLGSKEGMLELALKAFLDLGYDENKAQSLTAFITTGIGQQLRGMPTQIEIASSIYRDYPNLRESQLIYCMTEIESGYLALKLDETKFPKLLLKSHQAMNGAFALITDYLYGRNDLFVPYKEQGFDAICTELVGDITTKTSNSSDNDIVTSWIKRLELTDYFVWQSTK
jgi:hypothetical protein